MQKKKKIKKCPGDLKHCFLFQQDSSLMLLPGFCKREEIDGDCAFPPSLRIFPLHLRDSLTPLTQVR